MVSMHCRATIPLQFNTMTEVLWRIIMLLQALSYCIVTWTMTLTRQAPFPSSSDILMPALFLLPINTGSSLQEAHHLT